MWLEGLLPQPIICRLQAWFRKPAPKPHAHIAHLRDLATARERLSGMLGTMDDGVYALSGDGAQVQYLSPGVARIFERELPTMMETPSWPLGIVHPDDELIVRMARTQLQEEGSATCRYRVLTGPNETRWIKDSARLVFQSQEDASYIVGIVRDVTRQALAEQARSRAESTLRLLEKALAASPNGVVITDMSVAGQPIIYANEAFQRMTGYASGEILGQNCRFLQGTELDQQELQRLREAIQEGDGCTVTLHNFRKNGTRFWNRLSISPILNEQDQITHYVGVQQDITQTIESTKALADSERRLALTFDAINEGVWDYFVQKNRVFMAPSWSRIVGYGPEDLPQTEEALWFAIHPDDVARARRALESHLKGKSKNYQVEYRLRCKGGHEIWVESRGRVVDWDDQGQALRMVGCITDITERYGFEQQIMEWNARMDSIFTLSPDGFVYFDQNRRVEYANPAFETMSGMPIGKILNMELAEFAANFQAAADPSLPAEGFLADVASHLRPDHLIGDQIHRGSITLVKPETRVLAYELKPTPNAESLVLYLRDVTRETEVDRMKSEFLSTAAHELRTPMASIMGFTELLLKRDYKPEVAKDLLDTIYRQSKRLTGLLNDLLDLARIEARNCKDFQFKAQSVAPILCDALMGLSSQKGQSATVLEMKDDLPDVKVDEAKIQQAVMNVVSNAYKYSPQGGKVTVAVVLAEKRLGIRVSDEGIGMTETQLARLFERFYRADPSGNIPGTGLGMSLVKEIVERHGGQVDARSEFGKGTCITLWLPLAESEALAEK